MTGTIIAIAQQKGGSGKTTLAAHLAVALSGRKTTVAVLDIDPQGSLGEWFERREGRLGEDQAGVTFRTASGWGARREARNLARDHAFVIIDTPPRSDLEARSAIEGAALVVVPVQPSPLDLWATEATLALIAKEGIAGLAVLNRVPPRAVLNEEMRAALEALGPRIAATRIGNRIGFAVSMGEGSTVMESDPAGKGTAEMKALTAEIRKRLPSGTPG